VVEVLVADRPEEAEDEDVVLPEAEGSVEEVEVVEEEGEQPPQG